MGVSIISKSHLISLPKTNKIKLIKLNETMDNVATQENSDAVYFNTY